MFRLKGDEVALQANLASMARAPASFEVDLARIVMGNSPEAVFVQLDPLDQDVVTHSLVVRLEPAAFFSRPEDPSWRSFYDTVRALAPGRSIQEVDARFEKLRRTSNSKSLTVRAWFDRLSRFGNTGFALFATLDGHDFAEMSDPSHPTGALEVRPVVEVTMDVPVLVEFLKYWTKVAMEHGP